MAVEFEIYHGYIIAPGITMPAQDIYEAEVYEGWEQYREGIAAHSSESVIEAKQWIDRQIELTGEREAIPEAIGLKHICVAHPKCRAWVTVGGVDLCYECWNTADRPTRELVTSVIDQWGRGLLTEENRNDSISMVFGEALLG